MKFYGALLSGLFALLATSCSPAALVVEATATAEALQTAVPTEEPTEIPTPTPDPGLTFEKLRNSVFFAPESQQAVQLTDGKFESVTDAGTLTIEILPQIAIGDLNADGVEDAALFLSENTGGTGVFVSLVVITSQEDGYLQAGEILIDDRPIIDSLTMEDGSILFEGTIHNFDDVMAQPTLEIQRTYRILEGIVTLTRQSRVNPDGSVSLINITSPRGEDGIANPIVVSGDMPVAPFENNLVFTVYDLKGKVLSQSGFMVTAADVGAPATFNNTVELPVMPYGAWVRLELAELSMADGSLLTMDSVVVQIQ